MPDQVKALTIKDHLLMLHGYEKRNEEEWDRTRHLMSFQLNYGGAHVKKHYTATEVLKLKKDNANVVRPVSTLAQALKMLKEFNK